MARYSDDPAGDAERKMDEAIRGDFKLNMWLIPVIAIVAIIAITISLFR